VPPPYFYNSLVVILRSKNLLNVLSIGNQNDKLIVSRDEYSGRQKHNPFSKKYVGTFAANDREL
jgi:hypothetical protein